MPSDYKAGTSISGLTENEAKEFHNLFVSSFIGFLAVAVVAHFLVWQWRPWLPSVKGYTTSMIDGASTLAHHVIALVA